MACERYKARLINEALAPGGDSELAAHLSACAECSADIARQCELQNRITGGIAAMVASEPSPAFFARVRQGMNAIDAGESIAAGESPRYAGWLQWAVGGVAVAALAGLAIWFAGHALLRQSPSGPQPGQTAAGTHAPQTSAQNQPAPGSTVSATAPVAVDNHGADHVKSASQSAPRHSQAARLYAAPTTSGSTTPVAAPVANLSANGAPGFNVIIPPGQREAVLRLVAAMQNGRVDVAGLLKKSDQQEIAPIEIAPLKIVPLEGKKTSGQADGKNK